MFGEAKAERASIRDYFTNVIPSDYPVAPHIAHMFFNPEQSVVRKGCNQDTSQFLFFWIIRLDLKTEALNFVFSVIRWKKMDILIASCKWHRLMYVVVGSHEVGGLDLASTNRITLTSRHSLFLLTQLEQSRSSCCCNMINLIHTISINFRQMSHVLCLRHCDPHHFSWKTLNLKANQFFCLLSLSTRILQWVFHPDHD